MRFEFDPSPDVTRAVGGVVSEGLLGASLVGLMILLFLRDWRSSLIVVFNIPLALFVAVLALWITGQTINLMILGGLALAIGIFVDEATVSIENIHSCLQSGIPEEAILYVDLSEKLHLPDEQLKERVRLGQSMDYPTVQINVDREKAGMAGLVPVDVSRSLVTATSSSRFIVPNYWADPKSGVGVPSTSRDTATCGSLAGAVRYLRYPQYGARASLLSRCCRQDPTSTG